MKVFLVCVAVLLVGCNETQPQLVNQKERQRLFKECLAAIPPGPTMTQYNDWQEVVEECGQQAYYQALTRKPCADCEKIIQ